MNIYVFRPFKTGFKCQCGSGRLLPDGKVKKCQCPDAWRRKEYAFKFTYHGKQVMRSTGLTEEREAERRAAAVAKEFKADHGDLMMQALNAVARRKYVARIGEALRAYESEDMILIKDKKQRRKNVLALYRVLAMAMGLWRKNVSGPSRVNGTPLGDDVPDQARIDELPLTVLTDDLVLDYFKNACGGVANFSEALPDNVTINSVLGQARCIFSKRSVTLKMKHLNLPPLEKFLKHPGLPQMSAMPEPVKGKEFDAMLKAVDALPADDVRRTCNLILRQTGMRSGSLLHLHKDWLEKFDDGYMLHLRKVKGGTAEYSIPVTDEVAAVILARDGYTLPGDTEADRDKVVRQHTAWVKTVIGATDSRSEQGNHRLRDTVASIVFSWMGRDAAVEMLGNGREVNKKHYARLRINVTEAMKHELRAVKRLRQDLAPNVVPIAAADAKVA